MVLAAGAAIGVTAGSAAAQSPQQDALHKQGRARAKVFIQTKDRTAIEEAAKLFKDALALGDSPVIECDLGLALHYLGEDSRAHARLTRCMPRLAALSPDQMRGYRTVEDEVAQAIAKDHASVDLASTPPGAVVSISTFPADETVLAPTVLWLRAGTYELTAHVDGHVDVSVTVEITAADATARVRKTQTFDLKPAPREIDGDGGGGDRDKGGGLDDFDRPPPVRPSPPKRGAAYVTLGIGGALLVGGGIAHVMGRDEREHLATLSGAEYDDYLPTWQNYQRATIGLYAAGAVVTGIGAYLYVKAKSPVPVGISPAPEGRGAMIWVFSR
jgi:hypothetical protein